MTNKPKNFYDVLNDFGHWFGEDPIEPLEYIRARVRSIDMTQFSKQELQWMKEAEERGE